jgi:hypothetical protein
VIAAKLAERESRLELAMSITKSRLSTQRRNARSTVKAICNIYARRFVTSEKPERTWRVKLPTLKPKSLWPDLRPLAADRGRRQDRGLGMWRMTNALSKEKG